MLITITNIASSQNESFLLKLCCGYFKNATKNHCCIIKNNYDSNELMIDNTTLNEYTQSCCLEDRMARFDSLLENKLPGIIANGAYLGDFFNYKNQQEALQVFYNWTYAMSSNINNINMPKIKNEINYNLNINLENELVKLDRIKSLLGGYIGVTTPAPANYNSNSTTHILLIFIGVFLCLILIAAGFIIYKIKSKHENPNNTNLNDKKLEYKEPDYEYIKYNDQNIPPHVNLPAIPKVPPKVKPSVNLFIVQDSTEAEESKKQIVVNSIYNEAIDAEKEYLDDLYSEQSPDDFYSQVAQVDGNDDSKSQSSNDSGTYGTV